MKASSRIVFFGNERLSSGFEPKDAPTLTALIKAGYKVVAVVANHETGTSRKPRPLEIQAVAEAHGIPVLLPEKLNDIHQQLVDLKPTIGVLVAYGRMVSQPIIDIFPKGIINIHPSLLPLNRGSTPIEQAILDGVPQTGVSLMGLVKAMDAGPIFAQAAVKLTGTESKFELTSHLLELGGQMLIQKLPAILDGSLTPTPQDESKATFSRLLTKSDSQLDTSKPAQVLEREVRAFIGWPKSRLEVFGQQIIVIAARVATGPSDGALVIACDDQSHLEVTQLIGPSGRSMSGADFIRGYKK